MEPKFKVGDKVRILPFKKDKSYMLGTNKDMEGLVGQEHTVKSVSPDWYTPRGDMYGSDGVCYTLCDVDWSWNDEMLELVSCSKVKTYHHHTLKDGEYIEFNIGGECILYCVYNNHLGCHGPRNDYIFDKLGIKTKEEFCAKAYGYETSKYSYFPECKPDDYEALTRVYEALQRECEKYNASMEDTDKAKEEKAISFSAYTDSFVGTKTTVFVDSEIKLRLPKKKKYSF